MLPVGAIILAIGADLHDPEGEFGYGELRNVITSRRSWNASSAPKRRSRVRRREAEERRVHSLRRLSRPEGFTGCSRYCCPTAIKQAIELAEQGIDTTIFYRDIRTISTGAEEMYREARGMGVLFVRIPPDREAEVVGEKRAEAVRCFDELLGRELEVPTDWWC